MASEAPQRPYLDAESEHCGSDLACSESSTESSSQTSASLYKGYNMFDRFKDVLAVVNEEALPRIASNIRGDGQTCKTDDCPLVGSYNLVYRLTFADGLQWAVRIPQHGTPAYFKEKDAQAMHNEVELLRMIRMKTDIPVPKVYHLDTGFDNKLGVPFSVLQWLDGERVSSLWWSSEGPTPLNERRLRILDSLAELMSQLAFLSSPMICMPEIHLAEDQKVTVCGQGEIRVRNDFRESEVRRTTSEENPIIYHETGPFIRFADYLHPILDNADLNAPVYWMRGSREMLRIMIDAIGLLEKGKEPHFVLSHPDLNWQNILVREDGTVTGILDWDGIHFGPDELGCSRYPAFICRDWNPEWYHYWSKDCERRAWENSPSELQKFRKAYRGFIDQRLGLGGAKTINSHLFEAIKYACKDPYATCKIVTKICRVCLTECPFKMTWDDDGEMHFLDASPAESEFDSDDESIFSEEDDADSETDHRGSSPDTDSDGKSTTSGDVELVVKGQGESFNTKHTKVEKEFEGGDVAPPTLRKYAVSQPSSTERKGFIFTLRSLMILIMALGWLTAFACALAFTLFGTASYFCKVATIGNGSTEIERTLWWAQSCVQVAMAPFNWLKPTCYDQTTMLEPKPSPTCQNGQTHGSHCDSTKIEERNNVDLTKDQAGEDSKNGHISEENEVDGQIPDDLASFCEQDEDEIDHNDGHQTEDGDDDGDGVIGQVRDDAENTSNGEKSNEAEDMESEIEDPNDDWPWWLDYIFKGLTNGTLSDIQVGILKDRFAEAFSSTEVLDEWNLS